MNYKNSSTSNVYAVKEKKQKHFLLLIIIFGNNMHKIIQFKKSFVQLSSCW